MLEIFRDWTMDYFVVKEFAGKWRVMTKRDVEAKSGEEGGVQVGIRKKMLVK